MPEGARSDTGRWQPVNVPHTWNAVDGADGGKPQQASYRRGPAWYALDFPSPKLSTGQRAFLRFGAASMVADVYLNGAHLGQHRGAFTAFAFEITKHLGASGTNELCVRVDNSWVADIAPLAGDFTVFGGLYRPVELLVMPAVCINPLDYASPGVTLAQKSVNRERAEVEASVSVSRPSANDANVEISLQLLDAQGALVASNRCRVNWNGTSGLATAPLNVIQPRLWQGIKDPYLYQVNVELMVGGRAVDRVTQSLGLRSVRMDPKLGFFLNDEPYPLRGVCRHQDREGKGWAVSEADEREDMAIIREMGANALRLAHYPHSYTFLDLCDRYGLLVWAEIPLVNKVRNTPAFHANAEQQLVEMIRQQRNHPSIVMWGLFNELYHQGPTDPCEELVARLQTVAKREDPTRLTTAASNQPMKKELNAIPDLIACNIYPGWYGPGGPAQMGPELSRWLAATGNRGLGVSEYGAGGSVEHHEQWPPRQPDPGGRWHPEEYQSLCHEKHYEHIMRNPSVWGSFVWNAFDFGSDDRAEGDRPGINDKGLVTYDRQMRKDAFYFYKANWNPEPMIHLTARRHSVRKTARTSVRVYSNCDSVDLYVNGDLMGSSVPDQFKIACWPEVTLSDGDNLIQVLGLKSQCLVRDECRWRVVLPAEQASHGQRAATSFSQ